MDINWSIIVNVVLASIPALSLVFFILKHFFPGTDPYLRKGAVILAEVDDIIDGVLLKLPDNKYINTINE